MSVNEQHTDEEHKHDDNGASQEQEVQTEENADFAADINEGSEDSRIDELTKQAEENHQRFLRVQADFDNFRRRTRRKRKSLAKYASMKLIGQLLPVVDNFERAIEAAKSGGDFESFERLDMIFRQLEQLLEQEGLSRWKPSVNRSILNSSSDYASGIRRA